MTSCQTYRFDDHVPERSLDDFEAERLRRMEEMMKNKHRLFPGASPQSLSAMAKRKNTRPRQMQREECE
jgi:hypothetical protein